MTVKNATQLLLLIENQLGWVPQYDDETKPLWKARAIHAGRINKKIKENPKLYTWANLELAVELIRRKREIIRGPLAVFFWVEEALELSNTPAVVRPLDVLITEAERIEHERADDESPTWLRRFSRALGNGRQGVYDDWVAAGRLA